MMPKLNTKQSRRAAVLAEQRRRQREAEAESLLSREQLHALLDYLAEKIVAFGHDNTLILTRTWLVEQRIDADPVIAFLGNRKMLTDFDVALGADPNKIFGPSIDRLVRMPISRQHLEALIEWVDEACQDVGCDHSMQHSRAWLKQRGLPVPTTEFALLALGGGCDCEVVLNVDPDTVYPPGVA